MEMEDVIPTMVKPTSCIDIPKSQAQKLKIGQGITYIVKGKVKGIHEKGMPVQPNQEEKYGVDVEYDEIKVQENTADAEYRALKESV
jgi:hypothetical protein